MEKYLPFLRSLPLFAGLAEPELLRLLQCLQADAPRFAEGQIIWEPFRRQPYLCVAAEGLFQLMQEDFRGNRCIVGCYAPGDIFSGSALSMEGAPPFYLHAKGGATAIVLAVPEKTFPEDSRNIQVIFYRNLMGAMIEHEKRLLHKIEVLSRRTTRDKLMGYLVAQAAQQGSRTVMVEFTRQELADTLGVDRSAMCTELTRMQKDGLLRCRARSFELLGE